MKIIVSSQTIVVDLKRFLVSFFASYDQVCHVLYSRLDFVQERVIAENFWIQKVNFGEPGIHVNCISIVDYFTSFDLGKNVR